MRRRCVSRGTAPASSWPGLRPRRAFRWERRSALGGSGEPVGFGSVHLLGVVAHGFATLPQINRCVGRILRTRHSRVTAGAFSSAGSQSGKRSAPSPAYAAHVYVGVIAVVASSFIILLSSTRAKTFEPGILGRIAEKVLYFAYKLQKNPGGRYSGPGHFLPGPFLLSLK